MCSHYGNFGELQREADSDTTGKGDVTGLGWVERYTRLNHGDCCYPSAHTRAPPAPMEGRALAINRRSGGYPCPGRRPAHTTVGRAGCRLPPRLTATILPAPAVAERTRKGCQGIFCCAAAAPAAPIAERHLRPRRADRRGRILRPRAERPREGARGPVPRGAGRLTAAVRPLTSRPSARRRPARR
jgi:hypothetical protein